MHNIPTLINQYLAAVGADDQVAATHAATLSDLVLDGSLTLLQFIQHLGPHIMSQDQLIRTKAFTCLADTLRPLTLSKQDVNVMVQFLVDRLASGDATLQVLTALCTLVAMPGFLALSNAEKVLNALHDSYDPRKNLARVRHMAFEVLSVLGNSNTTYLTANLSDLYISTFVHLASGEKDPRNLLSSFALNRFINQNFDLAPDAQFVDDLFDVCFCYFPISFTPPQNDPYKITAQQLKESLRSTIACQSHFAKDAVPNLIEKLTSTNPAVRNDVLKTILCCVQAYAPDALAAYWLTLWNALKFEVLHNDVSTFSPIKPIIPADYDTIDDTDDTKLLVLTLDVLRTLAARLPEEDADNFVDTVRRELVPSVAAVKDKCKQGTIVLAVVAATSPRCFDKVVGALFAYEVWGKYLSISKSTDEVNDESTSSPKVNAADTEVEIDSLNVARQRDLVDCIGFIVSGYEGLEAPESFINTNALVSCKDYILAFLGQLLMHSLNLEKTLKVKTTEQLARLVGLTGFLSENEVRLVVGYMDDVLSATVRSGPWRNDVVVEALTRGLETVISVNAQTQAIVMEVVVASLLAHLDAAQHADNDDDFVSMLGLIGKLCVNAQILETLSIRLLNKMAGSTDGQFLALVENLVEWIVQVQKAAPFLMNAYYTTFVPRFLAEAEHHDLAYALDISGDLVGLVVRCIDASQHQRILDETNARYELVLSSPSKMVAIYNKLLANVDKSTVFSEPISARDVADRVVAVVAQCDSAFMKVQYLQTLALLNNKFAAMDEERVLELVHGDLEVSVWVVKALVMKLDAVGMRLLHESVTELFDENVDAEKQRAIAGSLRVLFADLKVFSNEINGNRVKCSVARVNNLNVKLLYKQQMFEMIAPLLVDKFEKCPDKTDLYMGTLAVMIENVSSKILINNLARVLPMVLQGIQVRKLQLILRSSLRTLTVVVNENSTILGPHIDAVVANLLDVATGLFGGNSTETKMLALGCLKEIFQKFTNLHEQRNEALRMLRAGLDDKKRSVRKMTSDLRQVLYDY